VAEGSYWLGGLILAEGCILAEASILAEGSYLLRAFTGLKVLPTYISCCIFRVCVSLPC